MQILWSPNPLRTIVKLDENEQRILWHRLKIEELEERVISAGFALDPEMQSWRARNGHSKTLEEWVAEARRELDLATASNDTERDGEKIDTRIDRRLKEALADLADAHDGDCTCFPCSCQKCHAEELAGVHTISGLGKHEAYAIKSAFMPHESGGQERTIDEALETLQRHQSKAYNWLLNYQSTRITKKERKNMRKTLLEILKNWTWFFIGGCLFSWISGAFIPIWIIIPGMSLGIIQLVLSWFWKSKE